MRETDRQKGESLCRDQYLFRSLTGVCAALPRDKSRLMGNESKFVRKNKTKMTTTTTRSNKSNQAGWPINKAHEQNGRLLDLPWRNVFLLETLLL